MALVLLCGLALAGCSSHRLHEAQALFDAAVRAEIAAGEAIEAETDLLGRASARNGYRLAMSLADAALERHEGALRDEDLLGTALMLKALCMWRVDDWTERMLRELPFERTGPEYSARARLSRFPGPDDKSVDRFVRTLARLRREWTLGTADVVMTEALDGLRDHAMATESPWVDSAAVLCKSALEVLDATLEYSAEGTTMRLGELPPGHPMRPVLETAALSVCATWLGTCDRRRDHSPPDDAEKNRAEAQRRFLEHAERLKPLAARDAQVRRRVRILAERAGMLDAPELTWLRESRTNPR